jgi:hypothetical protein
MYWGAQAERAFEHVYQRARIESFLRKLTGRPLHLLAFREVQERLRLRLSRQLGVREISLDKIVGSVGKPDAFTPSFLPRYRRLKERWKRVYAGAHGTLGLPPIEVYKFGEVYFIKDGHHRVSVARHLGATTMTADVTEYILDTQQPERKQIEELVAAEQGRR